MSEYILKVVGVVFISIMVDLIIPSGKMEKYVKGVMALVIVFVIISPIPTFIKGMQDQKIDISTNLIDENFVKKANLLKEDAVKSTIISSLDAEGINNADIILVADATKTEMKFLFVYVNLSNLVINEKNQSININETVCKAIQGVIDIKKENIIIYGK